LLYSIIVNKDEIPLIKKIIGKPHKIPDIMNFTWKEIEKEINKGVETPNVSSQLQVDFTKEQIIFLHEVFGKQPLNLFVLSFLKRLKLALNLRVGY
jgi:hypothetical protein